MSQQPTSRPTSSRVQHPGMSGLSPRRRAAQAAGMNGYNASPDLPPPLYVRALYNYDADDRTSLSFRQGDIIQVLTQLESGWWDGVINDVRGWFPSNYCAVLNPDEPTELGPEESETSTGSGTEEDYEDEEDDGDDQEEDSNGNHTQDDESDLPIEGGHRHSQTPEEAAFWVPQATPDGRLFYFNTLTGVSTMELPLETPASADETGPRDRNHFHVPEQTRPPPEMMAGGYGHNEEEYDGSASEADGELPISSRRKKTVPLSAESLSTSTSMESIDISAARQAGNSVLHPFTSMSASQASMAPLGTTATSFTVPPRLDLTTSSTPKYFLDDGTVAPVTWNGLVENMRASVEAYRQAIRNNDRAEFVRKAEDISDHLRMLLAAGSGTTDNHSGNNLSIISRNKALYPHFREMMSKFSKLVLSSHMAAPDWPAPDASAKCLYEADGVLNGVYGYVEVARQQRGEDIPRLLPGFLLGSNVGGNWGDNNLAEGAGNLNDISFVDQNDDLRARPSVPLDANLLRHIEDLKKSTVSNIRHVEECLPLSDKIVTAERQAAIGESVCQAAGSVIELFRPWINLVESIDLSSLGNVFHQPLLIDFGAKKQKVYDSIGELVTSCQAVTAPLPDEWAELRGESLDMRLNHVRNACKQLEGDLSKVVYSLQLQLPTTAANAPATSASKRDHRKTDSGETYQTHHLRAEPSHASNQRPALADMGQSKSYTLGQDPTVEKLRRPPTKDKARQFFGQVPPTLANLKGANLEPAFTAEEVPWYLQLDHLGEITYDIRVDPPQVKSGTLTGLVEQLTRHDRPETSFNTTFLLTYRSFTTASELFELLVKRFNIQPPPGLTRDEFLIWEEHKQKIVRFRVVNILKSWLEHYWMENDDEASKALLERIYAFAKNTITSTKIPGAAQLTTVVDQRIKGQDTTAKKLVLTLTSSAPAPILPKNMKKLKFLDIDPTEFARQLTIIESRLYGKIKSVECLAKTWEKKGKSEETNTAPNIHALILHSNQLTNWVAEMILVHPELKKRVVVIKHFVAIAEVSFSSIPLPVSSLTGTEMPELE